MERVTNKFSDWAIYQHDIECNQKYDKTLPYSFHLKLVKNFVDKFLYLIPNQEITNTENYKSKPVYLHRILRDAAMGHDLIEDARVTYNDVKDKATSYYENSVAGKLLADIIYDCTELRGHNRAERHGPEYIDGLKYKLSLFVKLSDIQANVSYGVITNSKMVEKYRKEYSEILVDKLYNPELDDMFMNLKKILNLK